MKQKQLQVPTEKKKHLIAQIFLKGWIEILW